MDFFNLNNQIKSFFPQAQVVFGGSQITQRAESFSDIDIYLIFRQLPDFVRAIKDKDRIFKLKTSLDSKVSLHFLPQLVLRWRLYDIRGIFYVGQQTEDFVSSGQPDLLRLNSLKLSWKNLILLKLAQGEEAQTKYRHDLQKNFYWLTGQTSDDVNFITESLTSLSRELKTFLWRDWLFYCLRFQKIFSNDFEKRIILSLMALNSYIDMKRPEYQEAFYKNLSTLGKIERSVDAEQMFKQINRFIFLIFVV